MREAVLNHTIQIIRFHKSTQIENFTHNYNYVVPYGTKPIFVMKLSYKLFYISYYNIAYLNSER